MWNFFQKKSKYAVTWLCDNYILKYMIKDSISMYIKKSKKTHPLNTCSVFTFRSNFELYDYLLLKTEWLTKKNMQKYSMYLMRLVFWHRHAKEKLKEKLCLNFAM